MGDYVQGESFLERLLEVTRLTTPEPTAVYGYAALMIPLAGRITGGDERFDIAQEAAKAVLSSSWAIPAAAIGARLGLAFLAVQRKDIVAAAEETLL